ncbi:MAG: DUF547 domain-containing protein [SAR324 cluster bacterium]|nr:DUF547 domain-containing protein [SAR324 cluster bacterium]
MWRVVLLPLALTTAVPSPLAAPDWLEALLAPQAELWARWQAHDVSATATIDHGPWQRFLDAYVAPDTAGVHRVAYARVSPADRARLEAYLESLASTPISRYGPDEQFAYWVNYYNALAVSLVLAHYPVDSIWDIGGSPGWFSRGPWEKKLATVEGHPISLNDIEHRILRPIWADPRMHYVLSCASVGCPNLPRTAITLANRERLLDAAAREYINDPRGVRLEEGRLIVSSIYNWFSADFGAGPGDVLAHLRRYAGGELAAQLEDVHEISGYAYHWRLNDAATAE